MHNVNRFMAVFDIAVSPCMTRYSRLATMWDVDVGCFCSGRQGVVLGLAESFTSKMPVLTIDFCVGRLLSATLSR